MTARLLSLADVCEINPRLPRNHDLKDGTEVSFVPMAAVNAVAGNIRDKQSRSFGEVKKGYTHFREGDVLFAKITPCMENGKAAVARELIGGFGFGSTEFHVLRSKESVLPEWLYYFIRREAFRKEAKRNFTGTAGQQRVPATFLSNAEIPVPALSEQRRIVDLLSRAEGIVRLRRDAQKKAAELIPAIFVDMFGDPATNPKRWPRKNLGDFCRIIGGSSLPNGESFTGQSGGMLLMKVSDMNSPGNEVFISSSKEWVVEQMRTYSGVLPGTIVFPKRGAAIATNKKRIATRPTLLDPNLMGVLPDEQLIQTDYLFQWFSAFDLADITSGTTVPQLNKGDLTPLAVPIPPLALQEKFCVKRAAVLSIQSQQSAATAKAQATFDALLASAFVEA